MNFSKVTGVALAGGTKRNPNNMIKFDYSKTYPYGDSFLKNGLTNYGITFNIMEDGSIIMNGTSTTEFWQSFGSKTSVVEGKRYAFSSNCPDAARYFIDIVTQGYDVDGNKTKGLNHYGSSIYTVEEGTVSVDWRIHVWPGVTLNNVVFKPMFNEGETLNDYYLPITAWSDVENVYWTKRSPANIMPLPYYTFKADGITKEYRPESETIDGVTCTRRIDGSILLNGTCISANGNYTQFKIGEVFIPRSGKYSLTGITIAENTIFGMALAVCKKDGTWIENIANTDAGNNLNFTVPQEYVDNEYKFRLPINVKNGAVFDNKVIYPTIQYGNSETAAYYANRPNPNNLVDLGTIHSRDSNGLTYTTRDDGSIHAFGTLTKTSSSLVWKLPELELGKTYTYHLNASNYYDKTLTLARAVKGFIQIYVADESGYGKFVKNVGSQVNSTGFTFTVTEDMLQEGYCFRNNIYIYDGNVGTEGYEATSYDFICYPMLNEGETAEPFYIE